MPDLLVELKDRVLYLTLNRPDKLNAMSAEMMGGLLDNLNRAATNPEVGAVVVTGAGRGFCAGGDIGAMRERNESGRDGAAQTIEERVASLRRGEEASLLLHEMPKVTIAAVNGPAAGAGLSVAMACDLRIASDTARFGTAFAKVGFSGDYGGTWSLTRLVGSAKARELYFLGDMISAEEALKLGLANRVYPAASFRDEVHALASRIANGPTIAYSYMKANLNAAITHEFKELLDREAWGQTMTARTEDHREAVKAFLEKRNPMFKGQ
ncbi:MAG: enoyl-CoA hydratase [Candidatus Binatus sp.]|uniref:enoyl-CoA hydratase n=1 Tax=Candidatus Binatus sp. TaxID=2811406 RepID=UPI00271A3ED4|nr:enoyl-CoA hydratase [Candidatus Binatus sp.]MDO8432919.1 enoyl-CoA hydratase [Candidatus Binatus sp.]